LAEAQRLGVSIPGDLSVVGFDDGDMRTHMISKMTAVCQDASALGREAFKMLEKLIGDGIYGKGTSKLQNCWFELHDTTGPIAIKGTPAASSRNKPIS
jgi:DNA-binding LacI/PurR family transcriptional regulator